MSLKVAVIYGSRTCEHDVSIVSALQAMDNLDKNEYEIVPVYIARDGQWYTGRLLRNITFYSAFKPELVTHVAPVMSEDGKLTLMPVTSIAPHGFKGMVKVLMSNMNLGEDTVEKCDVVLPVMHGMNGEDGTLQGLLELFNVPYTSTGVLGSALGMDKIAMKQFFRGAGTLPCLPDCWFTRAMYQQDKNAVLDKVEKELGYPVFVKPANLGSSIGVSRADDREGLTDSLELAFEYDRRVLVEKGLDHPIELNCSVLGYDGDVEASPIEMPLSGQQFLDFKEKYLANGGSKGMASLHRVLPAPIEDSLRDKIQAMSCDIFRMLDCKGVVRIDYMFDRASEQVYITEINTIPGSLAFYLWENKGVKYSQLIDRMVDCARKANEDRNMRNYAYSSDILKGVSLGGTKGAKGSKGSKF